MKASRNRVIFLLLGWLIIVVVCLLSLLPLSLPQGGVSGSDKVGHYLAYFIMTYWFLHLYKKPLYVMLAFILMGVVIEWLQLLTGYRFFEIADIIANTAGILSAWLLLYVFHIRLVFLK